jgi:hypothetical protein
MPPVHGRNSVVHNTIYGSNVKECVMTKKVLVASWSVLLVGLLAASAPCQETERAREVIKSDEKKDALEVLDIKFDPIHQGKNVVRVKAKNTNEQEQVFAVDIQAQSRLSGFGKTSFEHLGPNETKSIRFEFELTGPISDATRIQVRFHNPPSKEQYDGGAFFRQVRYTSGDLEHRNLEEDRQKPASQRQRQAVTKALQQLRNHMRRKDHEAVWKLLGEECRGKIGRDKLKQVIDSGMLESLGFFDFDVDSVVEHYRFVRLLGTHDAGGWVIDFVEKDGQQIVHFMRALKKDRRDWKQRLLPKMQRRSTPHYDIHYTKGSTAEREIDQIAERREKGFQEICSFLGKPSDVRICLVFFENARVKQALTGHQGAGWAFGRTIVEVYSKQQKLDPYHETVHILTPPYGKPPALFNEGIAVYMAERLGTNALAQIGAGQASIYERARGLKSKGEWIPLRELFTYTEIGSGRSRPPIAYPEAASFVKFLIDEYGKEKFLEAFKALKNSQDVAVHQKNATALERIYDKPLDDLRKPWEKALSTAGNTPDSSPSLPEEDSRNDSPDGRPIARGKVQAEIPENLRISDYFYFYGSRGVDYGALNDPVNNLILNAYLGPATEVALESLGIADLQQRLQRLQRGGLTRKCGDGYRLAFPAVVGEKRAQLQECVEQAAKRLLPLGKRMTEKIRPHLQGREEMLYHVLWSDIMDAPLAWAAAQAEMETQAEKGDTPIENKGWMIYPPHPSAVGTNSYDVPSGHLRITWSRSTPSPYGIHRTILRHQRALTDAIRNSLPVKEQEARAALHRNGLVDGAGKVRIYTLDRVADADVIQDYRNLEREFAREMMQNLDTGRVADLLVVGPGEALLIAYHEICWQLLQDLTEEKVLRAPDIVSTPGVDRKQAYRLVTLIMAEAGPDSK